MSVADGGFTPTHVVVIDLSEPYSFRSPGSGERIRPEGRVQALVRRHGIPIGMVTADAPDTGGEAAARALWRATAAEAEAGGPAADPRPGTATTAPAGPAAGPPAGHAPTVTVVVATHNRPVSLRRCLRSVLRTSYSPREIIVVDNAPADDASEHLVREEFRGSVRYVREPVAGLARAHNRGLAAARGEIVAFTDDDTLVDERWPAELAATFAEDPRIACVTGLIVPAELETAAQAALEAHGGFAKGFRARTWTLRSTPGDRPPDRQDDPLFPFTAGRFGSGTNMAFRADVLRRLGGFDPGTGTGTPARGGDDLLAFFRTLTRGYALAYRPAAVVWHHHHRTPDALPQQAFGYGAGLGAYLAAALVHEPRMLPSLLRRLPGGARHAAAKARRGGDVGTGWSCRLAVVELTGLLYGPVGYLRSLLLAAHTDRGQRASRAQRPRRAGTSAHHRTAENTGETR